MVSIRKLMYITKLGMMNGICMQSYYRWRKKDHNSRATEGNPPNLPPKNRQQNSVDNAQLVEKHVRSPGWCGGTCNPSTMEVETEKQEVQGHPELHLKSILWSY